MRRTDIHFEEKKPLPDIDFFRDEKDSVALAEKANDQRAEQRLRYRWPVQFAGGFNKKTTRGQIVDVSSRGLAMLCHADKHCPGNGQLVSIDFAVPHFGLTHSLDVVFFKRTGRVCRVDNLSDIVSRIAVQFVEPLFFKPGQQDISESDAQQILRAKIQSIIRAEERAKTYSEALAGAEEKLRFHADAKNQAEERVKVEAAAREILEEKLKVQAESITVLQKEAEDYAAAKARAEETAQSEAWAREEAQEKLRAEIQKRADVEAQMQDRVNFYTEQMAKIKAQAAEAVIWAKAEAEYAIAKARDEFEQKNRVYAESNIRADGTAKNKIRIGTKVAIYITLMLIMVALFRFFPGQRDIPIDYYNRGSVHLRNSKYDQAIFDFTRVIELAPKMAEAYYNRGNAFIAKGWYNQAVSDYTRAIEINPKFAQAYYNKGQIYFDKGQYDQAILNYSRAIEINPRHAKACYHRGLSYGMQGRYDQAVLDYTKAIELAPAMTEAYYNRGNAYIAKDQYDQAVSDFTKAIEIDPKLAAAYYNRAHAYYLKKEYDEAWQDVHKTESLGYAVHPIFLKELREASGK